jgi:hypothetical protein
MTQYVALLYYDRNQYWDSPPETEFAPEYTEFARRATESGVMRGGEALHPVTMSTTITVSGGKGGDQAIAWAAQNPGAWRGKIELRPVAPVHA